MILLATEQNYLILRKKVDYFITAVLFSYEIVHIGNVVCASCSDWFYCIIILMLITPYREKNGLK